jgi:hypothetical protein
MTSLRPGMTVEVVTITTAVTGTPAVPGYAGMDFIPYDGVTLIMYGWTGGRGGPSEDHSRPWSDRCVCNKCAGDNPDGTRRVGAMCIGGPGKFVRFTRAGYTRYCALCRAGVIT